MEGLSEFAVKWGSQAQGAFSWGTTFPSLSHSMQRKALVIPCQHQSPPRASMAWDSGLQAGEVPSSTVLAPCTGPWEPNWREHLHQDWSWIALGHQSSQMDSFGSEQRNQLSWSTFDLSFGFIPGRCFCAGGGGCLFPLKTTRIRTTSSGKLSTLHKWGHTTVWVMLRICSEVDKPVLPRTENVTEMAHG